MKNFTNEPVTDFTICSERQKFTDALNLLEQKRKNQQLQAQPIISGTKQTSQVLYKRYDPSASDLLIGTTQFASQELAISSVTQLKEHQRSWELKPYQERVAILRKLAELLRAERFNLAALIIREAGKPWKEADGEVVEAIDFCQYYAAQMERLGPEQKTMEVLGEENHYLYQARGVAAVISPWNFPLAITCGMTVAALVTGNAVALKPAEQTSLTAFRLAELILAAGFPAEIFAFLPGYGEEVGRALVNHPETNLICFTGSKAVGLEIIKNASIVEAQQNHIKRVIAELGGKNAIIVDQDADLDEAIKGALYSAFGYAGQKCSACSRLIVVGDTYQTLMSRIADAAQDLIIGSSADSSTLVGPVIDQESQARVQKIIEQSKQNAKCLFQGQAPNTGYYIPVTIFSDLDQSHPLWREEVFAPVLACCQADSFESALKIANDSSYALTGAVYTRSPSNIEKAKQDFKVGNLYINRPCTGSIVGRQPFGGFKLSGIGSKAGGPDYLLQFMEPRVVSENTMRRGFTPVSA